MALDGVGMGFKRPVRVLFLCRDNSRTSLMAEGLARAMAGAWLEPRSAGLDPGAADAAGLASLTQSGIDVAGLHSKPLDAAALAWADLVVTLDQDAEQRCPALPPRPQRRHFGCDPAAAPDALREALRQRIEGMIGGLRMLQRDAAES